MITPALPSRPSALIRLALEDLRKIEAQPEQYTVDMWEFHSNHGKRCHVCFAGAVISQTIKVPPVLSVDPSDFPSSLRQPLEALESFRSGYIQYGLRELGRELLLGMIDLYPVTHYQVNPEQFHSDMECLAQYLQKFGL